MSISRLKQIKRILKEHDVRDPRGALQAIEGVLKQKKPKVEKPLFNMTLDRVGNKTVCTIQFDREKLKPGHVVKAMDLLNEFGSDVFGGECDDPDCPVHGEKSEVRPLSEFFEKLEADLLAKNKGNLQ